MDKTEDLSADHATNDKPVAGSTHSDRITPEMALTLPQLQTLIREMFGSKDASRGVAGTFMWFMEEVGELSASLRQGEADRENLELEFADVLAWLVTLANISKVDLETAVRKKYVKGCPRCAANPCHCPASQKP